MDLEEQPPPESVVSLVFVIVVGAAMVWVFQHTITSGGDAWIMGVVALAAVIAGVVARHRLFRGVSERARSYRKWLRSPRGDPSASDEEAFRSFVVARGCKRLWYRPLWNVRRPRIESMIGRRLPDVVIDKAVDEPGYSGYAVWERVPTDAAPGVIGYLRFVPRRWHAVTALIAAISVCVGFFMLMDVFTSGPVRRNTRATDIAGFVCLGAMLILPFVAAKLMLWFHTRRCGWLRVEKGIATWVKHAVDINGKPIDLDSIWVVIGQWANRSEIGGPLVAVLTAGPTNPALVLAPASVAKLLDALGCGEVR